MAAAVRAMARTLRVDPAAARVAAAAGPDRREPQPATHGPVQEARSAHGAVARAPRRRRALWCIHRLAARALHVQLQFTACALRERLRAWPHAPCMHDLSLIHI